MPGRIGAPGLRGQRPRPNVVLVWPYAGREDGGITTVACEQAVLEAAVQRLVADQSLRDLFCAPELTGLALLLVSVLLCPARSAISLLRDYGTEATHASP